MNLLSRARKLISRAVERVSNAGRRAKTRTPSQPPRATPKPPKTTQPKQGSSKAELRSREFQMKADSDPAFYAWVNRVGRSAGLKPIPGQTLTNSRLNGLVKKFGCKDALELYELVTSNKKFGFDKFRAAYERDGQNSSEEYRYTDNNRLAMQTAAEKMIAKRGYNKLFD